MVQKASTHRLDPDLQEGLEQLSRIMHRTKNNIINDAVRLYVRQKGAELERDLQATLDALRKYREVDPDFEGAIAAFAESEAKYGKKDPVEGKETPGRGVRSEIRQLLHG